MNLDFDNILHVISRIEYLAVPQQVLFLLLLIFLLLQILDKNSYMISHHQSSVHRASFMKITVLNHTTSVRTIFGFGFK